MPKIAANDVEEVAVTQAQGKCHKKRNDIIDLYERVLSTDRKAQWDPNVLLHVQGMLKQMREFTDDGKFNRWLGFVQGVMWHGGEFTIEALRQHVTDLLPKGPEPVVWHAWPDDPPPRLTSGQYERYLVATSTHVFECSWLFGGWHQRHDGCSEVTDQVKFWAEKPKPPVL